MKVNTRVLMIRTCANDKLQEAINVQKFVLFYPCVSKRSICFNRTLCKWKMINFINKYWMFMKVHWRKVILRYIVYISLLSKLATWHWWIALRVDIEVELQIKVFFKLIGNEASKVFWHLKNVHSKTCKDVVLNKHMFKGAVCFGVHFYICSTHVKENGSLKFRSNSL